ncbi:MAG: transglutaminase domain-containing protein [Chitinophagaceae bacterium]|nr:transglutaminase domain-containing protein [Chitinophagaceae bacterium]
MLYTYDQYRGLRRLFLTAICILTILPLAPLINRYIPPIILGSWNVDLMVSIAIAAVFTFVIVRIFHFLIVPAAALFILVLLLNQLTDRYGFGNMVNDYRVMVANNWGNKEHKEADLSIMPSFFDGPLTKTVKALHSKVDHRDSVVRNFAVRYSLEYFDEYHPKYGSTTRVLSLFKYINAHFRYVSDAERDEYFATARETILNGLGGDCDDHTILMVSALSAIGARCRMTLTEGHLYPELFCGDKHQFEKMQSAILHLFSGEIKDNIYYHEQDGQYWINFDYTANHPGGPFVSDKAYAIIDL